jgi:hypothetical protein
VSPLDSVAEVERAVANHAGRELAIQKTLEKLPLLRPYKARGDAEMIQKRCGAKANWMDRM